MAETIPRLIGELTPRGSLAGELTPKTRIIGTLALGARVNEVYEGPYYVVPRAYDDIVLDTQDKLMTEDVTVSAVPYYETSNLSGGFTVYIARE